MTLKNVFFYFFALLCQFVLAQNDSIIILEEIAISDSQLKKFSNSQTVVKLTDSVANKNQPSLASLLNYNSTIYFKENGSGMVASPSFRGTTAQQTAVVWNGININSQLIGQTDFNTVSTRNFNSVAIRAGGGSAIYGSSAIGGTIHLNNEIEFLDQFKNEVMLNYGSFNTVDFNYKLKIGSEKVSSDVSFARNSSDNDYKYLDTDLKNENGQFDNNSLNFNFGYRINSKNTILFYSQVYDGKRHFSGTLVARSKSKYYDFNTRNLIEWTLRENRFTSKVKIAYLTENYRYFEDKDFENNTFGAAKTILAKYDLNFEINDKITLNSIIDFTETKGTGSDIGDNKRQIGSAVVLFKHQIFTKLIYEFSLRTEVTSSYKNPLLFAFGSQYNISKHIAIKANISKNFRIPTFNDLYWQSGGNATLSPENAFQYELGQVFSYKNFELSTTAFFIKLTDMIQWTPNASGIWSPQNLKKATNYGIESNLKYPINFQKNRLDFSANYAYTIANDDLKNKQLIYTPFHKATFSAGYAYKKLSSVFQYLYNGKVFTSSDNFYELPAYQVSNFDISYDFGKKNSLIFGCQIRNIFNENYQSVVIRPMPGRNYFINIISNF